MRIEKVSNGYILTSDAHDEGYFKKQVIEETQNPFDETNENECKAMQNLLYDIMEELGFFNSKHNQFRLNIEIINQRIGMAEDGNS